MRWTRRCPSRSARLFSHCGAADALAANAQRSMDPHTRSILRILRAAARSLHIRSTKAAVPEFDRRAQMQYLNHSKPAALSKKCLTVSMFSYLQSVVAHGDVSMPSFFILFAYLS